MKALERYWTANEAKAALDVKSGDSNDLTYSIDESESIIPDRTLDRGTARRDWAVPPSGVRRASLNLSFRC